MVTQACILSHRESSTHQQCLLNLVPGQRCVHFVIWGRTEGEMRTSVEISRLVAVSSLQCLVDQYDVQSIHPICEAR